MFVLLISLDIVAQCPNNFSFNTRNLSYWTSYLQLYNGSTKANTNVSTFNVAPASIVSYDKILEQTSPSQYAVKVLSYIGASTPNDSIKNTLSTVPNINGYQYNNSVKIGNIITKQKVRKMVYYINVPAGVTHYNITYAYALMLEDPGHAWDQQPRFAATVRDPTLAPGKDTIKCASVFYAMPSAAADKVAQGFISANSSNTIYYKDWTEVAFDLGGYAGKTIVMEFESDDCSLGGHFGYAYFALRNDGCDVGSVSGSSIVCTSGGTVNFSTASILGASYTWTLPSGWIGKSSTNTITVTPNGNSGNITVTPSQSCGALATRTIAVTSSASVPNTPGIIVGPTTVCLSSTNLTYTIDKVANASKYTWTIPAGWSIVSGADSATIILNGSASAGNGTISVVANNGCGASSSSTLNVTVANTAGSNAGISTGGLSVCSGTNVSLSNSVSSDIVNWQSSSDGGITWVNISNSASQNYTVSKATISALYRTIIKSGSCDIAFSTPTAVVVNAMPGISYQPSDNTICSGSNFTFSVVATGAGLTYQWQVSTDGGTTYANISNTGIYKNATTANLTLTNVIASAKYKCVITGTCSSVTSNIATLTISTSATPVIASQPADISICKGVTTPLSTNATGTNLVYQWYSNASNSNTGGTLITGATLPIYAASPTTSTYYYCKITSTCGGTSNFVSTNAVQVSVTNLVPVEVRLTASPSINLCPGIVTNVTFSATPINGGTPVYRWMINNVLISGATTNTYTNSALNDKDVIAVNITSSEACAMNNPANAALTIIVASPNITGTTSVCVGNTTQLTGEGTPASSNAWMSTNESVATVNSNGEVTGVSAGTTTIIYTTITGCTNSVTITVNALPTVASIGGLDAVCIGSTITLSNSTVGGSWISSDLTIATVNSSSGVVTGVAAGTSTISYRTATDSDTHCFNTITKSVTVVGPANITDQPSTSFQSLCLNATPTNLSITVSGSVTYQWYSNISNSNTGGTLIVGATTATYTPVTSSLGTLYYYCIVTNTTGCTVTSNVSGAINVISSSISFTTQPASNVCKGALVTYATQTGQTDYSWSLPGTLNTDYTIEAGGVTSSDNTVTLKWLTISAKTVTVKYTNTGGCGGINATAASNTTTPVAPPTISSQSTSTQTVCQNSSVSAISVTVSGSGYLYQWYSNANNSNTGGTYISGANSSSYTPLSSSAGTLYYYAVVTNSSGCSVNSNVSGAIIVTAAPSITAQPSTTPETICSSATATALSVTADAGSGTISSYKWYSNTSNSNSGGTLLTTNTKSSTSDTYTPASSGALYYYVVVTNSNTCTGASNASGLITINAVPAISTNPLNSDLTYCKSSTSVASSLNVVASGSGTLTYQWYYNTSASTSGATSISGATSSAYKPSTSSSSTPFSSGVYYYCKVSSSTNCTPANSSFSGKIIVSSTQGTISTNSQPKSQDICGLNSTPTNLSVSVSINTGSKSYQWYSNTSNSNTGGTSINSATSSSYTPPTSSAGNKYYYVITTNGSCKVASNTAYVNVFTEHSGSNPSITLGTVTSIPSSGVSSFRLPYSGASADADKFTIPSTSPSIQSSGGSSRFTLITALTNLTSSPISIPISSSSKSSGNYTMTFKLFSTSTNYCNAYTFPITIVSSSTIAPGDIGNDQTICSGQAPATITSLNSATYSSTPSYQWQYSTDNSTYNDVASSGTSTTYSPGALTTTTYYRRKAYYSNITPAYTNPVIITVNSIPTVSLSSDVSGVCQNGNITFTTSSGKSNYLWTFDGVLSTDYSLVSGGTNSSNTAVLKFLVADPSYLAKVNYTENGCSASSSTSKEVIIYPLPTPTFTISPNNSSICNNSEITYSTAAGMTNYIWNIPGVVGVDYNITSGSIATNSYSLGVKWVTNGSKILQINYTDANSCTATSNGTNSITVVALPTASFTAGPTSACTGVNSIYTTQSGQSNYVWTVPGVLNTDYEIVSGGVGSSNNTVTLKWLTSGSKVVSVNYSNSTGCSSLTAASVTTVVTKTTATFTVSPGSNSCINTNVTYTASNSGNSNFVWSVPGALNTDYQIISGSLATSSYSATLKWLTSGSKNVTLNYTNSGCASSTAASSTTTVQSPTVTYSAKPAATICGSTTATYTINSGKSDYTWTVPGILNIDYGIISGGTATDNTLELQWFTAGDQYVSVLYTDAYGCLTSDTRSTNTSVSIPIVTFTAEPSSSTCIGNSVTYTTQSGCSNYTWSIPGVAETDYHITSGGISTTSNTVTLQWLSSGIQTVSIAYDKTYGVNTCSATIAATNSVLVNANPSIYLGYVDQIRTIDNNFLIPFTNTTAYPDQYSISIPSPSMSGFSAISNASLGSSPISVSVPTSSANTYTFGLTVKNSFTGCISSNYSIPLLVTNINPGGIGTSQTICAGSTPSPFTSTNNASYYSGSGSILYQWQSSTTSINSGYNDISLATSSTYSPSAISQTTYFRRKAYDGVSVSYTSPATITVNDLPVPIFTSSTNAAICANSNVTYATDLGQSNYVWSIPGTINTDYTIVSGTTTSSSLVLKWLTGGTKSLSINYRDANGCSAISATSASTTVYAIPVPALTPTPNTGICAGASIVYATDASKSFYKWSVGENVLNTDYQITSGGLGASSTTATIKWLTSGTKTVTINYTDANGCIALTPTSISTIVTAPTPTLTLSNTDPICANSSVTYTTESGKSSYVWAVPGTLNTDYQITSGALSSSSNTATLKWLTSGSKTIAINYTDGSGCTAKTATSKLSVVYANPTITISSYTNSVPVTTVFNFSINYTAISQTPNKYLIAGTVKNVTLTDLPSSPITFSVPSTAMGTYAHTLSVKNTSTGCVSEDYSFNIVVTNVIPGSIASDQTICSGATPTSLTSTASASSTTGSITYQWQSSTTSSSSGFTNISLATSSTYTPGALTQTTYYRRAATDSYNTAYTTPVTITVTPNPTITLSSSSANQTVCNSSSLTDITFSLANVNGASVASLPSGLTGKYNSYTNIYTISGIPTTSGAANYTITATSASCGNATTSGTITVSPLNTITLSSSAGTDAQTKCINTSITNITYTTAYATGATFSGLPTGVTGSWSSNTITISGTPSVAGTFDYTITLTGGCGIITKTGTITVNPANTITLISAAGTDAQNPCNNTFITDIQYSTTGATGATFSGLPTGVSGSWNSNIITILGSVSSVATSNYTITLTGGCSNITKTGSITTKANTSISSNITANTTVCSGTSITPLSVTASGSGTLTYQWYSNTTNSTMGGTAINAATSSTYTPSIINAGTNYYYVVIGSSCDPKTSSVGEVIVNQSTNLSWNQGAFNICSSSTPVSLDINAVGAGVLSYQWYSNASNSNAGGSALSGETNSTYEPVISSAGTTYYYVIVSSNLCNSVTSSAEKVVVTTSTSISSQPASSTSVCANTTPPQLNTIGVGGGILSYEWYSNASNSNSGGTLIADATDDNYIPSVSTAGTTYYYVNLTSDCGTVTSNVATVVVNAVPAAPTGAVNASRCATGTVSLSMTSPSSGLTIDWYAASSGGSVLSGGTATASFTTPSIENTTSYYAQTRNTTTSCISTTRTSATATVNNINLAVTGNLTQYDSITLVASGGTSYTWSGGAHTSVAQNVFYRSGYYSVSGTDANSCTDTKVVFVQLKLWGVSANGLITDDSVKQVNLNGVKAATNINTHNGKVNGYGNNGKSASTAGTSALDIKTNFPSSTDGIYWIKNANINSGIPFQIYADMTTDGGGWMLLNSSGGGVASSEVTSITSISDRGYLPRATVIELANISTKVQLRSGPSNNKYAYVTTSNDSKPITALRSNISTNNGAGTWHYNTAYNSFIATSGTWIWSVVSGVANGWPNMYHSNGNAAGVHWLPIYADGAGINWASGKYYSTWVK